MPFFQHEETGGCVQTFFGNKPPSIRFYEITEKQYKMWLANQAKSLPTTDNSDYAKSKNCANYGKLYKCDDVRKHPEWHCKKHDFT